MDDARDRCLDSFHAHRPFLQRAHHAAAELRLVERLPGGFVGGVDPSADMVALAQARCPPSAAVQLEQGTAASLPFPDERFAAVFSVHTLYFWTQPVAGLREVWRVLRPAGRVLLGYRPRADPAAAQFPPHIYRFYDPAEVEGMLAAAGFREVASEEVLVGTGRVTITSATKAAAA